MTTRSLGRQPLTGTGLAGGLRPRVRRRRSLSQCGRGPRGEVAPLTARHDEVTPGTGPLRAIPVRPQVALPALRALLTAHPLTKTHQHTVTRDRIGFTMPRPLSPPATRLPTAASAIACRNERVVCAHIYAWADMLSHDWLSPSAVIDGFIYRLVGNQIAD